MCSLLESVLVTTDEFKTILADMPDDNTIADILYKIVDTKSDIKTNYNLLNISNDKNDEITFLPDSQYQRFITKGDDVSSKTKSKVSIGRMVGQILRDNGHVKFKDSDIEKFVNSFKSIWNKNHGIENREIRLVKGEEIKKWYNSETYASEKGTLGNSCMRYPKVNKFMDIYAVNPDKISMVILTRDGQLIARAIIWRLSYSSESSNKTVYLDRIYTESDSDVQFVYDWVLNNVVDKNSDKLSSYLNGDNNNELRVDLNNTKLNFYPYADTFNYLYERIEDGVIQDGGGFVTNINKLKNPEVVSKYMISEIRNHNVGVKIIQSHIESEYLKKFIPRADAINAYKRGFVLREMCTKCKYDDEWYLTSDLIYSEVMEIMIPVGIAENTEEFGWIVSGSLTRVGYEYIGEYDNPIDVIEAYNNHEELYSTKKVYLGDDRSEYPVTEHTAQRGIEYYHSSLVISDIFGDIDLKSLCYEVYRVNRNMLSGDWNWVRCTRSVTSSHTYILKEDAKIFGIDINNSIRGYVSFHHIRAKYRDMKYDKYVKSVNESNLTDEEKENALRLKRYIHEYNLDNYSEYRTMYEIESKVDIDKIEIFNDVLKLSIDNLFSDNNEFIEKEFIRIIENNDVTYSSSDIAKFSRLLNLYIRYYEITHSYSDTKSWLIRNYVSKYSFEGVTMNSKDITIDIAIEVVRIAFQNGIKEIYSKCFNNAVSNISNKYDISESSLMYYIQLIDPNEYNYEV
jgi:hypothetical protein